MAEYEWRIRIDLKVEEDEAHQAFRELSDDPKTLDIFVVQELENKVHYHGYIKTRRKADALRDILRRKFKVEKDEYSVSKFDPEKATAYYQYMCKGVNSNRGDEVRVIVSSTPRLIDVFHNAFHDKAEEIKNRGPVEKAKVNWIAQLIEEARNRGFSTREQVADMVCEIYVGEWKKCADPYILAKIVWTVCANLSSSGMDALKCAVRERVGY